MATPAQWIEGARPRTLPAAFAPVIAGTGAAAALPAGANLPRALLALLVAIALQVGVNYANDYADGIRGTDGDRVGPLRLTGSRAAPPAAVRAAAIAAFAVAAAAGLVLVALSGRWWLLLIGAACLPAAWYYTGGKSPYGYRGFGEVFVFVFFGLVAVLGTTFTQAGELSWAAFGAACGIGALACAILVANNLRDISGDRAAGKHTLAVRLGEQRTRVLYLALVTAPLLIALGISVGHPVALLALLSALALRPAVRAIRGGAAGLSLITVLRDTGRAELIYGVLLAAGLTLS